MLFKRVLLLIAVLALHAFVASPGAQAAPVPRAQIPPITVQQALQVLAKYVQGTNLGVDNSGTGNIGFGNTGTGNVGLFNTGVAGKLLRTCVHPRLLCV